MGKVLIPILNKGKNKYKEQISKFPQPYCNIEYETKANVIGHIMDSTNNSNNAINDRLRKSTISRKLLKGKIPWELGINTKLRLILFDSLISIVLLYSLHIVPICKTSIIKLQQFHSKCTRIRTHGYCQSDNPQVRNDIIRQRFNIHTVESKLKYFRLKTYYKWEIRPNQLSRR